MKYWWLKRYKGLKIKLIPELTRQVNDTLVMPKNYKDRYNVIKNLDINSLNEEDLLIYLYYLLNFEKIKNNKVILLIDHLLEVPDTSMPSTNYNLNDMLDDVKTLKSLKPLQEKISNNNIAACYNCQNVYYVDKIKYVNKKGLVLCPYCKSTSIYFDNDFIPMDYNFLRLAAFYYGITPLGCTFSNLKTLIRKYVHVRNCSINDYDYGAIFKKGNILEDDIELNNNNITFTLKEIMWKKEITSKEEKKVELIFDRYLSIVEKNLIESITIDTSILVSDKNYALNIAFFLTLLNNLGKNQYLKEINLICNNENDYNLYKEIKRIMTK